MNKPVTFSIIIPSYNRERFILATLASTLEQTYPHYEVIVVDDGSEDNTDKLIASLNDPRIIYYKKKNEERAVARNTGFQLAKGDYVTLLDSDDYFYPNHLEEAARYINENGSPEIIRFDYDIVDSNKNRLKVDRLPDRINRKMTKGNYMGCSGILLRRDIALAYPFNPDRDLSGSEDYELWLRLAARFTVHVPHVVTCSLHAHDERSVIYNIEENTLVKRIQLLIRYTQQDRAVKKIFGTRKDAFISHCYLYISLHLAIAKINGSAIRYLFKAINTYPPAILDKRFLGILKTLIVGNINSSFG
jgi:glycosyltransferase involved in cell wall biosynthesis